MPTDRSWAGVGVHARRGAGSTRATSTSPLPRSARDPRILGARARRRGEPARIAEEPAVERGGPGTARAGRVASRPPTAPAPRRGRARSLRVRAVRGRAGPRAAARTSVTRTGRPSPETARADSPRPQRALERARCHRLVGDRGLPGRRRPAAPGRRAGGVQPPRPIRHDPAVRPEHRRDDLPPERARTPRHHGLIPADADARDLPFERRQAGQLRARRISGGEGGLDRQRGPACVQPTVGSQRIDAARASAPRNEGAPQARPVARGEIDVGDPGQFAQIVLRGEPVRRIGRRAGPVPRRPAPPASAMPASSAAGRTTDAAVRSVITAPAGALPIPGSRPT